MTLRYGADIARITTQLHAVARPLDMAVWHSWCGAAPWQDVLSQLVHYQNADGGFGHGIEPDVWHPASSPLATTVALQYVHTAGIPSHHPVVHRALVYLARTYDAVAGKWHPMVAGVNDYPHAPWWHADATTGRNALDDDWPNPTVEIIGYLGAYDGADVNMSAQYDALVACIADAQTIESHALACYVRAYAWLPSAVQTTIYPHIVRLLQATIHPDPAAWLTAYVPTPLDYVHSPASPFYAALAEFVEIQLAQWVAHVQAHHVWTPTWAWGQYDDAWRTAHAWWTGKMTVERILILARFGRIV